MHILSSALNALIVILLLRLFAKTDRESFFNPYVAFVGSRLNRLGDLLRPFLALPESAVFALLTLLVFLFKSAVTVRLSLQPAVAFGETFRCVPSTPTQLNLLIFNLLETLSFILKFWGFHFLVSLIARPGGTTRMEQALEHFARPFSKVPYVFRPILLTGLHVILAFTALNLGSLTSNSLQPGSSFTATDVISSAALPVAMIKTAALGVLAFCESLSVMISALFAFIIGSLIATFMRKPEVMMFCREGSDLILGRFSRGGTMQAGLDFTPLIFFIVANLMYNTANVVIFTFINQPFNLPY